MFSCAEDAIRQSKRPQDSADVFSGRCRSAFTNGRPSQRTALNGIVDLEIKTSRTTGFCTGTFITPDTILTAAHCFEGASGAQVIVKFSGKSITTSNFRVNETFFNSNNFDKQVSNDSALVFLSAQ